MIRENEYDNYQISEYDPTIPAEQRQRLIEEAQTELNDVVEEVYKATH